MSDDVFIATGLTMPVHLDDEGRPLCSCCMCGFVEPMVSVGENLWQCVEAQQAQADLDQAIAAYLAKWDPCTASLPGGG